MLTLSESKQRIGLAICLQIVLCSRVERPKIGATKNGQFCRGVMGSVEGEDV